MSNWVFYEATLNDAKIMERVITEDENLGELIKENDILIADRGFRDCTKNIKREYKIDIIIPTCNFVSFPFKDFFINFSVK